QRNINQIFVIEINNSGRHSKQMCSAPFLICILTLSFFRPEYAEENQHSHTLSIEGAKIVRTDKLVVYTKLFSRNSEQNNHILINLDESFAKSGSILYNKIVSDDVTCTKYMRES
ncbi:MAG: hypothetical protein MHPSP_004189, partial [Paramarteilia canceri]